MRARRRQTNGWRMGEAWLSIHHSALSGSHKICRRQFWWCQIKHIRSIDVCRHAIGSVRDCISFQPEERLNNFLKCFFVFLFYSSLSRLSPHFSQHWHSTWYVCTRPFVWAYLYHKYIRHLNVFIILFSFLFWRLQEGLVKVGSGKNFSPPATHRTQTRRWHQEGRKSFLLLMTWIFLLHLIKPILETGRRGKWVPTSALNDTRKHPDEPHWSHYLTTLRLTKDDRLTSPFSTGRRLRPGDTASMPRHKSLIDT